MSLVKQLKEESSPSVKLVFSIS